MIYNKGFIIKDLSFYEIRKDYHLIGFESLTNNRLFQHGFEGCQYLYSAENSFKLIKFPT